MAAGTNRALFVGGMLLLGGFSSCQCPGGAKTNSVCPTELQGCETNSDCPDHFVCRTSAGHPNVQCCDRTARTCKSEPDCCPGQTCSANGRCVDVFDECPNGDSDCGDPDRVCQKWVDPVLGESMRCTYASCAADGSCPEGQSCFDNFCVINAPCNGSCPEGEGCVPQDNRCHPYGALCKATPQPGKLVVFKKPENVYDTCVMSELTCELVELPPLHSNDLGRYASAAVSAGQVHVAMYDGQYGDLVVADYDETGKLLKRVWVDGVPSGKTPVAGPSGPRGGVSEPGDDVGRFTSIAAAPVDGTLSVSYYDVTNGDLKYVERGADGTWGAPLVVDSAGDTGLFTSIKLDPTGKPVIAYFQKGGGNSASNACPDSPLATGLKVATATKVHPTSAADFTIETVSCSLRPEPPCYGCSAPGSAQVCASGTGGGVCKTPMADCAPACVTGQICVAGAAAGAPSQCVKQGSSAELAGIPLGSGLFPSLAFKDAMPVVAWYDHAKGNLMLSQNEGGTWKSYLLDGQDGAGKDTGNVGLFPSLAFDASGNYLVAYHDASKRRLKLFQAAAPAPSATAFSVIDDGLADPMKDGPSYVGADASLLLAQSGNFVAYQNSTGGDLRLAKFDSAASKWTVTKELTEGALGFFSRAVEMGGKLYLVHTRIHTKQTPGKPVIDNHLKVEVVTP